MKKLGGIILLAALAVTGCESTKSVNGVYDAKSLGTVVAKQLKPRLHYTPTVTCPQSLSALPGSSVTCTMTDKEGKTHDVVLSTELVVASGGSTVGKDVRPKSSAGKNQQFKIEVLDLKVTVRP